MAGGSETEFDIEFLPGLEGLAAWADDWRALADRSRHPAYFHYPDWHAAYLKWLSPDPRAVVACRVRRRDRLVALTLLERGSRRVGGKRFRTLAFPQDVTFMPAGDLVLDRHEPAGPILHALLARCAPHPNLSWDLALFEHVLSDTAVAAALRESGPPPHCTGIFCVPQHADVVLLRGEDGFQPDRRARDSKQVRRLRARTGRPDAPRLCTAMHSADIPAALEAFMDIENSGWKGRAGTAIRSRAERVAFWRQMAAGFGARQKLRVHLLVQAGRPIAGLVGITAGETCYLLKSAYDETRGAASPGHQVMFQVMRHYYDTTSVREVNLLSEYGYMEMWGPVHQPLETWSIFQTSLSGAWGRGVTRAADIWRAANQATLVRRVVRRARRLLA